MMTVLSSCLKYIITRLFLYKLARVKGWSYWVKYPKVSSRGGRRDFGFGHLANLWCLARFTGFLQFCLWFSVFAGAIISDGDRKSWDARGPMIWDNFSIFKTNCAILTSFIRADLRTCRGLSRECCHVV